MTDYIIHSIWYTKPLSTWNEKGEVVFGRKGETVMVGMRMNVTGQGLDTVESIEHKKAFEEFYVTFKSGWLLTIPRSADTEICYKKIADNVGNTSNKTNKGRV